jgi:hypothetical protein
MRAESQLPPRASIPSTLSDRPLAGWTETGVLGRSERRVLPDNSLRGIFPIIPTGFGNVLASKHLQR